MPVVKRVIITCSLVLLAIILTEQGRVVREANSPVEKSVTSDGVNLVVLGQNISSPSLDDIVLLSNDSGVTPTSSITSPLVSSVNRSSTIGKENAATVSSPVAGFVDEGGEAREVGKSSSPSPVSQSSSQNSSQVTQSSLNSVKVTSTSLGVSKSASTVYYQTSPSSPTPIVVNPQKKSTASPAYASDYAQEKENEAGNSKLLGVDTETEITESGNYEKTQSILNDAENERPETPKLIMKPINSEIEDSGESHFFLIGCIGLALCIILYLVYQSRSKILAFLIEGKRPMRNRVRQTSDSRDRSKIAYKPLNDNPQDSESSKGFIY